MSRPLDSPADSALDPTLRGAPPLKEAAKGGSGFGTPLFSFGPWLWASLGVVMAGFLAISGVGLLFFYQPGNATSSLIDLEQASDFGFLRDLHYWAGHALLLAAWVHLARVFAVGSYRRRLGWRVTVALVVLVTTQAWLGGQLAHSSFETARLLAIYALHILILPMVIGILVLAWARQRARRVAAAHEQAETLEGAAP